MVSYLETNEMKSEASSEPNVSKEINPHQDGWDTQKTL